MKLKTMSSYEAGIVVDYDDALEFAKAFAEYVKRMPHHAVVSLESTDEHLKEFMEEELC